MKHPKPPKPPECIKQCGFCYYTAKKSEYKHTCWSAIIVSIALCSIPTSIIIFALFKIYQWIS